MKKLSNTKVYYKGVYMTYKKRLCEYIRYENKWLLILLFLSCVAGVVFSIFIPILQSNLINSVEAKTISIIQILIVVLLSFVAIFLVSFTSILTPILMLKFQNKIKYSLMQSVKYVSESFLLEAFPTTFLLSHIRLS